MQNGADAPASVRNCKRPTGLEFRALASEDIERQELARV